VSLPSSAYILDVAKGWLFAAAGGSRAR